MSKGAVRLFFAQIHLPFKPSSVVSAGAALLVGGAGGCAAAALLVAGLAFDLPNAASDLFLLLSHSAVQLVSS
jgi:hypothetical protein